MKLKQTALAFAAITASLNAQTDPTAGVANDDVYQLPELLVTALLWESDLQSTTASVSAIDSERLQSSGTQHFGDLINTIPNLSWSATSSRPRYIQIRGIGENSQFEGETPDSSVRFLVDDLDFTGLGTIGNLFDVQQVEVLRGPQAGAFGVNAAGGVVQIVTNDPTPYWSGQVEGTIGNDSLFAGGFALGGPLLENDPERLTFRFSTYQLQQDGFRDNQFLGKDDTNERDELNTRLKLRWIANEDWQWDATLFYADADNGYDEWSRNNTRFDTFSNKPGRDTQESFGTSLRGQWTGLNQINVTTISSFSDTDSLNSYDGDWTNETTFASTERQRKRWSEELRFDSAEEHDALGFIDRWTGGVFLEDFKEDTSFEADWGSWGKDSYATVYETQTLSLYGQGTHLLDDQTRITLGLRLERYDLETDVNFKKESLGDDPNFDDWLFGGKLTIEHDLADNKTVFASMTKGYKVGGANIDPNLEAGFDTSYDTENLWNYEIGLRAEWLDGLIISQLTTFYMDRKDAQLRSSTGQGIDFRYATFNGGDAEHYGAETEATWFINDNWSVTAGLGLLDTELDSTGDELSSAPNYTYNARIDYVAENGFFANFEVTGSDEFFESNNPDNRDQRTRSEFIVYNAAIGYSYANWTLTLWGRNIFDEEYEKRIFYDDIGDGDKRYEDPADPQQFGVTLNYEW